MGDVERSQLDLAELGAGLGLEGCEFALSDAFKVGWMDHRRNQLAFFLFAIFGQRDHEQERLVQVPLLKHYVFNDKVVSGLLYHGELEEAAVVFEREEDRLVEVVDCELQMSV